MTLHYSWTEPAEGADRESVIFDTSWLRVSTESKAEAMRFALRERGIEPNESFVIHFYPDGEWHDYVCIVTAKNEIVAFDFFQPGTPGSGPGWTLIVDSAPLSPEDRESGAQMLEMVAGARAATWPCPACSERSLPGEWVEAETSCPECGWVAPQLSAD